MFASPIWRKAALESAALGLLWALDGGPEALEDFENQATALCESAFAPVAVEPTLLLLKAIWRPNTRDDLVLRALLATAIVRYVDTLANCSRSGVSAKSIKHLCLDEDLPEDVVEVRHQIAHKDLPDLPALQLAARMAFEHVVNRYWRPLVPQQSLSLPDDRRLETDLRQLTQVIVQVSQGLNGSQINLSRRADVSRAMNTLRPAINSVSGTLTTILDLGGSMELFETFCVDFLFVSYNYFGADSSTDSDEIDVIRYSMVKILSALPPWTYKRIVRKMCGRISEVADDYGVTDMEQSHASWCVVQRGRGYLNSECSCRDGDYSVFCVGNLLSWLWGLHFVEEGGPGGSLACALRQDVAIAGRESARRSRPALLRAWVRARVSKNDKIDWRYMEAICERFTNDP